MCPKEIGMAGARFEEWKLETRRDLSAPVMSIAALGFN